jgi:hypothetical protein
MSIRLSYKLYIHMNDYRIYINIPLIPVIKGRAEASPSLPLLAQEL